MATPSDLIFAADRLIDHTDLLHLECSCLLPAPPCIQNLALLTLEEDVPFNKNFCIPQLFSLLGALYYLDITVGYILKVKPNVVSIYLSLQFTEANQSMLDTMVQLLTPQYPTLKKQFIPSLSLYDTPPQGISSVTFVPTDKQNTPAILSQLFTSLRGQTYTLLFLLTPMDQCTYLKQKKEFLLLFEKLFPLREKSDSYTDSCSKVNSKSCSTSESKTNTATTTANDSTTTNQSLSEVSSSNLNFTPKLTDKANISQSHSSSCTSNHANNTSNSESNTCTQQLVNSNSDSDSDSCTTTNSHTYGSRSFNKEIDLHIQKIEQLIALFDINLTLPVFEFSAYFLASSIGTSLIANSTYTTLIQPTAPLVKSFYVNDWYGNSSCLDTIMCYLQTLRHPLFCPPSSSKPVTPTLVCNNYQLNQLLFACTTPST